MFTLMQKYYVNNPTPELKRVLEQIQREDYELRLKTAHEQMQVFVVHGQQKHIDRLNYKISVIENRYK